MAARHEEGRYEEKKCSYTFLFSKGLSTDEVRVTRGTVFQETPDADLV